MYIPLWAIVLIVITACFEYTNLKKRERHAEARIAALEQKINDSEQAFFDQPQPPYQTTDHEIR
jgi:hypothetical protein